MKKKNNIQNNLILYEPYEDNDELIRQMMIVKCSISNKEANINLELLKKNLVVTNKCSKEVYKSYKDRIYLDNIQNNIIQEENIVQEEHIEKGGGISYVLLFIMIIILFFYLQK